MALMESLLESFRVEVLPGAIQAAVDHAQKLVDLINLSPQSWQSSWPTLPLYCTIAMTREGWLKMLKQWPSPPAELTGWSSPGGRDITRIGAILRKLGPEGFKESEIYGPVNWQKKPQADESAFNRRQCDLSLIHI